MTQKIETPKWDVALAALVRDDYDRKETPLKINDFRRLATEHRIRFDDIMVTMFELVIHGEWRYLDASGAEAELTPDTLEKLYVNRRLQEVDLQDYDGGWEPR